MTEQVLCTIIARNYLAQARCLVASFLEHHPQGRAFVLLVDELGGSFDLAGERFTTILLDELEIQDLEAMRFRYSLLELSTAVKPFFLEYLFRHHSCRTVCYFDPDIYFFAPIDDIWDLLEQYAIVLTPHLTGPLDDDHRPTEFDILQVGAYNLGFIGLSAGPDLYSFLRWWQDKLVRNCVMEPGRGLFVDQRWMDLAPSLFPAVHIHRAPGCNVAYWNLGHRAIAGDREGNYTVNGEPLEFFHFSGFSPDQMGVLSKHQDRFSLRGNPRLRPLFDAYADCLRQHGYDQAKAWPSSHDFHHGILIPPIARVLWRQLEDVDSDYDPFQTSPDERFVDRMISWLNQPVDNGSACEPGLTRLAWGIYQLRPDLQALWPDVLGSHRGLFAHWFVRTGAREYQLEGFFVRPVAEADNVSFWDWLKLPHRQRWALFYYDLTNWLFRSGIGVSIEQGLGLRRVRRIRQLLTGSDIRTRDVPGYGKRDPRTSQEEA
jgi:hypothetical protein